MIVALFDIDGTLLNTGGAGQAAMEAALADVFGIHVQPHGIPTAGRTDRAITEDLFAHFGIPNTVENRQRFVDAYIDRLQTALQERQGSVLPGVRELLGRLSAAGTATIIGSVTRWRAKPCADCENGWMAGKRHAPCGSSVTHPRMCAAAAQSAHARWP